jgi:para-nitrobenzyl esterase
MMGVRTTSGLVTGLAEDGIEVFKGVPYGAPTNLSGRFRPPALPEPWRGERPCRTVGFACPQPELALAGLAVATEREPSGEDCLVVNVFTPAADRSRRPVMVWFHGGAWTMGSGGSPGYDGRRLARRGDVVVVTVNHRLGYLGFLYLGDLGGDEFADSGNVGTLDMVASLRWVHDNIESFGGDPDNVTVFGESGGGFKVSTLLATPTATGLFHRAVIQSGPYLRAVQPDAATAAAEKMMAKLGVGSLDELVAVPADSLVVAQVELTGGALGGGGAPLGPVLDGRTIPANMFEPVPAPSSLGVPLLIGTCKDEMTLFSLDVERDRFGDDRLRSSARSIFGEAADAAVDVYERTRPGETAFDRYIAMTTDRFRVGSIRIAERRAASSPVPVYMYRFDFESPLWEGKLRAPHAMEIPFVFDNLDVPGGLSLHGGRPGSQSLADRVSEAWLGFARAGNPSHPGLPAWPAYEPGRRSTMLLDEECRVVEDPDADERHAWDQISAPM